jgi:uncharacterized membrane protein YedE/YeeE
MSAFTPLSALAGGLLIGLSSVLLLRFNGRIAGISGIAGGLWFSPAGDRGWRIAFVAGLILGAGAWVHWVEWVPTPRARFPTTLLVLSGLLVGYGTSLAGGCTSGHGVCGVARVSPRSLAATAAFLAVAIATTFLVRHLLQIA